MLPLSTGAPEVLQYLLGPAESPPQIRTCTIAAIGAVTVGRGTLLAVALLVSLAASHFLFEPHKKLIPHRPSGSPCRLIYLLLSPAAAPRHGLFRVSPGQAIVLPIT